ncbi:MAG: CDP-diacylglycerol--glycerol-3-phosphate 3-phosphatidyltransferase [Actinomycetia bacterium]|nr:CDP-diacylglycerol--glycerol-3-phosphate 3-phosphatidyltransferase [Actinomycetes bacterium]
MTLADQLTVTRIAAVPVVILFFAVDFPNHAYWGTGVFVLAMMTDQVDGWLARRVHSESDLGKILDPVADKVLVLATMIVLISPVFPGWMVAAIVARELLVSGLRLAALERGVVVSARELAKLKTWAQAVACGLGGLAAGGAVGGDIGWWALVVALGVTWLSGLEYVRAAPSVFRRQQPA